MPILQKTFADCVSWVSTEEARYCDIDQQAACLTGYDQEYLQLSRGQYNGWFKTILLGSEVGLYFESFDQKLDQWGACPSDQYGFIFLMEGSADILLNGAPFDHDCIMVTSPGSSFDCNSAPGTKFGVISVSKLAFELFATSGPLDANSGGAHPPCSQLIRSSAYAQTLRQMTHQGVRMAAEFSDNPSRKIALASFETSLINLLVSFVLSGEGPGMSDAGGQASLKNNTALQARAYLHDTGTYNVSVAGLLQTLGISRRKLEYDFRNHFGISPAEYIRVAKLNQFRTALLRERNHARSIGDIAADLGIWHLSRLAQYYRLQFGELPSETRIRKQAL